MFGVCVGREVKMSPLLASLAVPDLPASEAATIETPGLSLTVPFGTNNYLALFAGVAQPHGQRADHEVVGTGSNVQPNRYPWVMQEFC